MNELALFAGAGGGILGGKLLGWTTVCAVESNSYASGVLVARQNDSTLAPFPIWDDVCTFDGRPWRGRIDVVSGGFPCQAYSSASRGKSVADDLWPEMRRIVADVAPRLVFAENVQRRAIERAADELEEMGYEAKCIALSAKDMGADHIRQRYWLLAHADRDGELLRTFNAKAWMRERVPSRLWETFSDDPRVANWNSYRMDRLEATGNMQVPYVAATAFHLLAAEFANDAE